MAVNTSLSLFLCFLSYLRAVLDVDRKVPPENKLHLVANYSTLSAALQQGADKATASPLYACSTTSADAILCKARIWHLHIHHLAKLHYF